ncbi:MAG: metal-dependent transcriptional regulator [Armatimonadota bacterium]
MNQDNIDHLLEQLWVAEEDGIEVIPIEENADAAESQKHRDVQLGSPAVAQTIGSGLPPLIEAGVAEVSDGMIRLTLSGHKRAEELIRRHRLAECLLSGALEIDVDTQQDDVCILEHALSAGVADSICAFLGHPPTCPHGRAIPRGDCCGRSAKEIAPLVRPLRDVPSGQNFRISFISSSHNGRLDRLAVLGLTPGADIFLQQKRPSYVLRVGETDIAVDKEIAADIFVKPV